MIDIDISPHVAISKRLVDRLFISKVNGGIVCVDTNAKQNTAMSRRILGASLGNPQ